MTQKAIDLGPGALALVDQAVDLLRRRSGSALAEYYLGSLPFILAFLYFWSDMSRNALAAWYCGPSAAGLALAFIWMKIWQVRFCRRLWCRLQGVPLEPWTWKRLLNVGARQAFLHAVGLVALGMAALIVLPLAWVFAFFQNLCVLEDTRVGGLRDLTRDAASQAMLWPGQNHLVLTIMSFFGLFVFLNLALGVMAVPYLFKWVLGVETVFTLSGIRLLNTTFLTVICGLAYLCIDPILKTVYVLRCFYGRSRQTGEDIRAALRVFRHLALLVCMVWIWAPQGASAATANDQPAAKGAGDLRSYEQQLDQSIETVLQQRRFAWRLPREKEAGSKPVPGWISGTAQWIVDGLKTLLQPVGRWLKKFMDWLRQKLPGMQFPRAGGTDHRGLIRLVFYALGFLLAFIMAYWMVRRLIRRRTMPPAPKARPATSENVDLTDEGLTAKDLPLDQWMVVARDLMARNDLRQALRAFYLSVLALLADHRRVTIARYKSNQDYVYELARHAHAEPELLSAFEWCVRAFERIWYGMHPVDRSQVDAFMNRQQRITTLVRKTA